MESLFSSNGKVVLCDGDIVITNKETLSEVESSEEPKTKPMMDAISSFFVREVEAVPFFKDYKVSHYREGKIFALNIASIYNWVLYKSKNNKEVTQIISGGSYCQMALGFIYSDKLTEERYIYRNKAHNCVKYKFAVFSTPWATIKVGHHDIIGNATGGSSYRLWHS